MTTLAGPTGNIVLAGYSVEGTGPSATFYLPQGITIDDSGNLYVADSGAYKLRKVTPGGTTSTIGNSLYYYKTNFRKEDGYAYTVVESGFSGIFQSQSVAVHSRITGSNLIGYENSNFTHSRWGYMSGIVGNANGLYVLDYGNSVLRKMDFESRKSLHFNC